MEAGEVTVRGLVVPGRDASPGLELVDQALDDVPLLVEVGVVADGPTDPDLLQHGDELWAVGRLPGGQDERKRAALAVSGEVNLAGLSAPRASQEGSLQSELSTMPDAS